MTEPDQILKQSQELMEQEPSPPVEVQPFKRVNAYTTFFAEYTTKQESDYHFHFFVTPEMSPRGDLYWQGDFPRALDKVARGHFGFDYPRLQASIIRGVLRHDQDENSPPQDSWWLIVQNLTVPDPEASIELFLEKLDQELESSMITASR